MKRSERIEGLLTRIGSVARSRQSTFSEGHDRSSTSNVQNTGVFGVALSRFQQWQQCNSSIKLTFDIQIEHLIPTLLLGEVDHGGTPSQTRVVDQDIQSGLDLLDLFSEGIASSFATNISLKGNAKTLFALGVGRVEFGELSSNLLEVGKLARGDVDFGTVANVGGGDHLADTRTTAGDQGNLAIECEEALSGELGHDFGCCILGHVCDSYGATYGKDEDG